LDTSVLFDKTINDICPQTGGSKHLNVLLTEYNLFFFTKRKGIIFIKLGKQANMVI